MQRVRTATGKRQGRIVTAAGLKPQKNTQLQQGALAFMKASTKGLSIMKGRQVDETRKLLVAGGFRSRDAIVVYTFFKLVSPLVFLAAAALYVYGIDPIGKGAALDAAAVVARRAARQQGCPTSSSRTCARSGSRASARRCPTRSTCWSSAPRPASPPTPR